jgi:hypothetical protein
MSKEVTPLNEQSNKEGRIDDLAAALEESEEQNEESSSRGCEGEPETAVNCLDRRKLMLAKVSGTCPETSRSCLNTGVPLQTEMILKQTNCSKSQQMGLH